MLRTVRPTSKLANILRWEGILIDPLGALFVVMVYEFIISDSSLQSLHVFALILIIGFGIGIASGMATAHVIRHRWLPEYLQPFAVLVLVLGVFAISNHFESESGLLTVTVMGMWLANAKDVDIRHILHFKENLTIMFITGLFILLAARIEPDSFSTLGVSAIVLFAVIQLVSRPLSIFIATLRSNLNFKEKIFLAWVAPRGIVAASVSALFAIKLYQHGVEEARLLVPLIFMVIIGTVVLQSISAKPMARMLGVAEPAPKGFLVIGANDVARSIALALKKYDCRVVVADSNWDYISQAKMSGLEFYFGNPTSSHADEYLDLIGIGHVAAVTPDKHFNIMSCMQYVSDFGSQRVFCLRDVKNNDGDKHIVGRGSFGQTLFGGKHSFKKLASLINQGAEIKHTKLSENFTYQDYLKQYADTLIQPVFVVTAQERIHLVGDSTDFAPSEGETVVSLVKKVWSGEDRRGSR